MLALTIGSGVAVMDGCASAIAGELGAVKAAAEVFFRL